MEPYLVTTAIRIAGRFFPALAPKISGPEAVAVAREVVRAARSVARLDDAATPDAVMARLEAAEGPALSELKLQLETIALAREEADLRRAEIEARDRQHARDAYLARIRDEDGPVTRQNVMLVGVVLALIICVVVATVPRTESDYSTAVLALITTIAGALLKMFSDAFAFEFGSSRGSKNKDLQISAFSQKLKEVGDANARIAGEAVRGAGAGGAGGAGAIPPGSDIAVAIDTDGSGDATTAIVGGDPNDAGLERPSRRRTEARDFVRDLVEGRIAPA